MKASNVMIAVSLAIFIIAGCEKSKVVKADKLIERDGLKYEIESKEPFTGTAVEYWPNGNKKIEGKYHNGQLEGTLIKWHENEQKSSEVVIQNGEPCGKAYSWYKSGQKRSETEYIDGKNYAKTILWHENGQKKEEIEWRAGKMVSSKEWDERGKQIHKEVVILNYKSGTKRSETSYREFKRHGPFNEWYESGQLKETGEYSDDDKFGTWKAWYENGQLKEAGFYISGDKSGDWTFWFEDGQKREEGHYSSGNPYGKWTTWLNNGLIESKREYGPLGEPLRELRFEYKDGHKVIESLIERKESWSNEFSGMIDVYSEEGHKIGERQFNQVSGYYKIKQLIDGYPYILKNMALENIRVDKGKSWGKKVWAVFGTVVNKGPKSLSEVTIRAYYLDADGNRIWEKDYTPILSTKTPLRPGYRKEFGYNLEDDAPTGWNKKVESEIIAIKFMN